jgi:predicted dehydrogenase
MGNASSLDIASEDYAVGILKHKSGATSVFYSDYFSKPKRHMVEVQAERGWAKWDFVKNTFEWYSADSGVLVQEKVYKRKAPAVMRNDMYRKELMHFFALLEGKEKPMQDLARGAVIMRTLLAIKTAARTGRRVKL